MADELTNQQRKEIGEESRYREPHPQQNKITCYPVFASLSFFLISPSLVFFSADSNYFNTDGVL